MRHLFALGLVVVAACKGSAGDPGTDGTSCTVTDNGDGTITVSCDDGTSVTIGGASVTRVDDEPEGDNCEFGGTAVHTGVDDDADGVLDDEEIDDTAYVCNGSDGTPPCTTLEGDIVVRSHADLLLLGGLGCSSIEGALMIEDYGGTTLDGLESLTSIGGLLYIQGANLADVGGLANVQTVGSLAIDGVPLTSLAPLNLSSTDGAVEIEGAFSLVDGPTLSGFTSIAIQAPSLETLELGTLPAELEHYELWSSMATVDLTNVTTIEGGLWLAGDDLATVNAPQLEGANSITLTGPITTLNMGALTAAGTFSIEGSSLSALPLGSLEQVSFLTIIMNQSLTSLDGLSVFDVTALGELTLYGNTALTDISAVAGMTTIGNLRLGNLSSLSTFSTLQSVGDSLVFLDGITSVTQLTGLTSVQHLYFFGTDIVNLDGLNSLTTLQTLQITCNPDVATLNGLDGLTHVDSVWIGSNPDLTAGVRNAFVAEFTYDSYFTDADTCP